MSACRRYRPLLIDRLDGTLAPGDAERLDTHLQRCPACAKALEDLGRTRDLVRTLPAVEPPPWLEDRILVRVHTRQGPRRASGSPWLRSGLPAVALVVLCLTGYLVLRHPGGTPAMPPAAAPVAAPAAPQAKTAPAAPAQAPPGPAASRLPAPAPAAPPPAPPMAAEAAPQAQDAARRQVALEAAGPMPSAKASAGQATGSLALSWEPLDPIRAASQAQAAFTAAGATLLSRPGPDYRGISARVPGPALDALLDRLEALGPLTDAPRRPTRRQGEVLVNLTW